jgi:hypothetical protein
MGALSSAGTWLYDIGRNIVQGLMNGVSSLAGTIGQAFLNTIPGWIVGPFKEALGIASPSKLFRGFGQNIGQGVVLGIGDLRPDLESATSGMVTVPSVTPYGAGSQATAPVGAFGGAGGRMTLMVGGREFDGYVTEMADGSVQAADSQSPYMRRGRG